MAEVKKKRPGTTISSKHQVTIPVRTLRDAGLSIGERLIARVDGPGRVILERERDAVTEYAGRLTGVYEEGALDRMRDEWD